jgi:hypothetical protein
LINQSIKNAPFHVADLPWIKENRARPDKTSRSHAEEPLTGEKLNRDILQIGNGTRFVLICRVIQISLEAAPDEN